MSYIESKNRLRKHLRRMIRDGEQLIADLEWWNKNRTDAPPFDVGGQRVLLSQQRDMLAIVESDQRVPDEIYQRMVAQAEALCTG